MSFASYEFNARPRECIKPDLNEDYMSLFFSSVPINQFLFGGDTSKRLEEIEKTNKVVGKAIVQRVHTQGSVTTRVVARTNLEALANDLRLSDKALRSVLFRKKPIPPRKPVSKTAKRGREEQGDKALRTIPVNVQTTNEV